MSYVDGFLIVLPKKNIESYKEMAREGADLWKKYGALDYKECVGEDLTPAMSQGEYTVGTFPGLVGLKEDETIVFSYIVFRDRAHRDEVNAKVMSDPSMQDPTNKGRAMPFEMKKMHYGGFETVVEW